MQGSKWLLIGIHWTKCSFWNRYNQALNLSNCFIVFNQPKLLQWIKETLSCKICFGTNIFIFLPIPFWTYWNLWSAKVYYKYLCKFVQIYKRNATTFSKNSVNRSFVGDFLSLKHKTLCFDLPISLKIKNNHQWKHYTKSSKVKVYFRQITGLFRQHCWLAF